MRHLLVDLFDRLLAFAELISGALGNGAVDEQVKAGPGRQYPVAIQPVLQHLPPPLLLHQHLQLVLQEEAADKGNGGELAEVLQSHLPLFFRFAILYIYIYIIERIRSIAYYGPLAQKEEDHSKNHQQHARNFFYHVLQ
jgi:hypothetical protein